MKTQQGATPQSGESNQPRTRRKMSPAARRKISAAVKAAAQQRKQQGGTPTGTPHTYAQALNNLLTICGNYPSRDQIRTETEAFLTTQNTLAGQHLVGLLGTIADEWASAIGQSRPRAMGAGH